MLFLEKRTPYFDLWMLIFYMLIWQLKALPDIFFGDTDFKIEIFKAKTVSFRDQFQEGRHFLPYLMIIFHFYKT